MKKFFTFLAVTGLVLATAFAQNITLKFTRSALPVGTCTHQNPSAEMLEYS